ncbi:efflux RND transporter periplasmic adaptor subunit [Paenibacillus sp. GP183]|uniref:efflux RND transporter periplasmic adaptor subunit n=1 Tax=Paenibacillus sp. GP183 TaxID=1882751 RepID=UPI00089A3800|nr:efflux RND transporter periplasmic adaptor subunit [Paenibacillus sp. GP183]SEC07996.1 RND family efflux transporter, MFP subunit [Paenibacillus sp. GP183]
MRKKRLKSHRSLQSIVGVLALCFTIMAGCDIAPVTQNAVSTQANTLKNIKVSKVIMQKVGDPTERAAEVQSSFQYDLIAKVGGDVGQILKKRGDLVQADEVIIKLNSNETKFQKEMAAIAVRTLQDTIQKTKQGAKKDLEKQRLELSNSIQKTEQGLTDLLRNYNKMRNDYDIGLVTKNQLYQTESQMMNTRIELDQLKQRLNGLELADSGTEMEAQLKNAQFSLQQAEQAITNLDVKAPVSGLLTEMPLETGMSLKMGANIGVILKLDPIKIKAQLTLEETNRLKDKKELTYYLPGTTQKYKGSISYLSKVIDPKTNAYEVNLEVPNKDVALKPGMKVMIQLTDEKDQIGLTVPSYSIVKEGEDAYVFVLAGDSVEKRKVQLGRLNEPFQEVISGVKEGERVVVSSPNQLKDKEKIGVTENEN